MLAQYMVGERGEQPASDTVFTFLSNQLMRISQLLSMMLSYSQLN